MRYIHQEWHSNKLVPMFLVCRRKMAYIKEGNQVDRSIVFVLKMH